MRYAPSFTVWTGTGKRNSQDRLEASSRHVLHLQHTLCEGQSRPCMPQIARQDMIVNLLIRCCQC